MEHNERCHHARQQLAQCAGREPAPPRSPAAPAGLLRPEATAVWSSPWCPLRHSSALHVESAVVSRRRWYGALEKVCTPLNSAPEQSITSQGLAKALERTSACAEARHSHVLKCQQI